MTNYISILQILDNILSHPLLQDVSLERVVNYAQSFIQIVGMPTIFNEKTEKVEIKDYRGILPCDYYEMIQVRTVENNCRGSSNKVMRYSTDSFHMSKDKLKDYDLTYKLQGGCIFTSIKEGVIELAYRSIMVDENGFPLIPENSSFIKALELYIKKECFTTLFDLGKINQQVLQHAEQQYAWAVGQAQSDLIRPSVDQLQSLTNSWNTLIQRTTQHDSGFKYNGVKEYT